MPSAFSGPKYRFRLTIHDVTNGVAKVTTGTSGPAADAYAVISTGSALISAKIDWVEQEPTGDWLGVNFVSVASVPSGTACEAWVAVKPSRLDVVASQVEKFVIP